MDNLITDCMQHTLHLMKSSLPEYAEGFGVLQNFHTSRKNRFLIQYDLPAYDHLPAALRQIHQMGFQMMLGEQTMRQLSVICDQQQALRIHVQSSDRKKQSFGKKAPMQSSTVFIC